MLVIFVRSTKRCNGNCFLEFQEDGRARRWRESHQIKLRWAHHVFHHIHIQNWTPVFFFFYHHHFNYGIMSIRTEYLYPRPWYERRWPKSDRPFVLQPDYQRMTACSRVNIQVFTGTSSPGWSWECRQWAELSWALHSNCLKKLVWRHAAGLYILINL